MDYSTDERIVMTLDAGGTNFVFSAIQSCRPIIEEFSLEAESKDLDKCLKQIIKGFEKVQAQLAQKAQAISFAFPGPADYKNGIIGDLGNLPAFKGGVALGPMLENHFNIPVYINNDGNLFTYGEALQGFLPQVNKELEKQGNPKRYKNLIGLTLGTGFGAGIVLNEELLIGDNSNAAEVWLLRNFLNPDQNMEESISKRAIMNSYTKLSKSDEALTPKDIYDIAKGNRKGDRAAALQSFERFGQSLGEAIANLSTLIDGLIVIGGGLSASYELFIPALMKELNGSFSWNNLSRLVSQNFDLENSNDRNAFLKASVHKIEVPMTTKMVDYDPQKKIGVGLSSLGTNTAVAIGAYIYALKQLDKNI